ncbi:MAG TPA: PIN domain-containing protein [Candidatus Baltobacteraceae bacterium]|nr:PIN domain-containing protein [Candidatus Baltobacteraceae bacterium]
MSVALDTNVIVNVVSGTRDAAGRAVAALTEHSSRVGLVISPIVYAELFAHPRWRPADVDEFLVATSIAVDWNLENRVWIAAGNAFRAYAQRRTRKRAGMPRRLLADFVIGAHASVVGTLITSDADFYRTNFPELHLVCID